MFVHRLNNDIIGSGANPQTDRAPEVADENNAEWVAFQASQSNYSTASKLKILAYFDGQGEVVRNQFLAVLKADDFLYEQWLAANEIDISHPAIPTVRDAMQWTQQQVQELFNALNTQQA